MADYHSLLARAVANLPKPSTPAARKAIYDRARAALLNQLRSLKPQLPESDIAREEAALDDAVARLEAENVAAPAPAPIKPITPPPRPARPPPARTETPPRPTPAAPPIRAPAVTPPVRAASAASPAVIRAPSVPPPIPNRSPAATAPAQSRAPLGGSAEAPQLVAAVAASSATPRTSPIVAPVARATSARNPVAESETPVVVSDTAQIAHSDNAPKIGSPAEAETPMSAATRLEPEPPRPTAPSSQIARRVNPWIWIGLAVAVGLIGSVAVAAFLLREKPQDLTIKDPTAIATPAPSATNGQKIAQRVGDAAPPAEPTPEASESTAPSPIPTPESTPVATESPTAAASSTPAPAATSSPAPTQAAIPVAARAAMLVADGADTQKPTVSVGSVVWSPAPAIPGQPGSVGVKAEIDIPDLRMHASMVLRKNVDPGLPASHTIDFRVTFDPGSPIKGVKDIALPLMRRDDPPAADALIGVRVKINDGYYLVGLNRADSDVAHNIDEIATRGWFDFPMQLSDDRIAKLTFEKAADGDRVVADALAAWK